MDLTCTWCNKPFVMLDKEYKRQTTKRGRSKFFCSLSCNARNNNHCHPKTKGVVPKGFKDCIRKRKKPRDPFKEYIRRIKNRSHLDTEIVDVSYLKELWCRQSGTCALTGIPLKHPTDTRDKTYMSSLDRIDVTKGYVEGNVQFVSLRANYAKAVDVGNTGFLEFLKLCIEYGGELDRLTSKS